MNVLRGLWWVVKLEVLLYAALLRWVARRPHVPDGAVAWGYSRLATPVIALWIFASALEVPLVHVITPWPAVRIALLVLSVWGLVWMVGMLASIKVYPHLVTPDGLRVRYGKFFDLTVPWSAVASVRLDERDLPGIRFVQPLATDDGVDLQLGTGGRTNVSVSLSRPVPHRYRFEPMSVTAVTFWVDEPREFVAAARRQLSAPTGSTGTSSSGSQPGGRNR